METSSEQPVNLNLKAAKALATHKDAILLSLLELQKTDPQNEVLKEVEKYGGIGVFGMSLDIVADMSDGANDSVTPKNAEFVVAYLNSVPIQKFISDQSEGEVTPNEVSEVRDFFVDQL